MQYFLRGSKEINLKKISRYIPVLKSLLNSFYTVGIQVHITDVQVHFWVYLNVYDFQSPTFRYRGVPERLITHFSTLLLNLFYENVKKNILV